MNKLLFSPDSTAIVSSFDNEEQEIVTVKTRIGNYVILSNGIRFHILDDRCGPRERPSMSWELPQHGVKIQPILAGS
jgi:hypothetical protein